MRGRNGKLRNKKFFQHTDSHCRRTSEITSREDLEKSQVFISLTKRMCIQVTNDFLLKYLLIDYNTWFSNQFLFRLWEKKEKEQTRKLRLAYLS